MIMVVSTAAGDGAETLTVSVDPNAFIIMADVAEVVGEGFKHWKNL